jgi:hypothetical protein
VRSEERRLKRKRGIFSATRREKLERLAKFAAFPNEWEPKRQRGQ